MRNINIIPVIQSLILVLFVHIVYTFMPPSTAAMKVMGWLGIIQFLFSVYSWSRQAGSALTPYVIFISAAYIFTFGQSILYVFDCVSPQWDLLKICSVYQVYAAQKTTLVFLNFFHIGALFSPSNRINNIYSDRDYTQDEAECIENQISGIRLIGKLFLVISTIPFIIEIYATYQVVSSLGYGGLYMQEAKIGIFNLVNVLSQYFLPGILCLLIVETQKFKRNIYIGILLFDIAFWMFVGGRSNGVIIAAILLIYYHICVKKIGFKKAIFVAFVGYFFVSFLAVIAETRSDVDASIMDTISNNLGKENAFFDAISAMGGSMFPMIKTMALVPEQADYRYGSSYCWALTSVIPNLGFWDLHPAMKYANLNEWLQKTLHLGYGPGFSIVAEAYINFGEWGFLMMMLLGYVFASIFNADIKNPLLLVLALLFCYLIIKTVRNSFLATIRSLFYYILPIYITVVWYKRGKILK